MEMREVGFQCRWQTGRLCDSPTGDTVVEGRNVSLVLPDLSVFQKMLKMQIFVKCEISQIFNISSIENNSNIVLAKQKAEWRSNEVASLQPLFQVIF